MFRQHIACHHQGALVVLAKSTIKHAHDRGVRSVAAYRGSVCAMYLVRVSRAPRNFDVVFDTFNTDWICTRKRR